MLGRVSWPGCHAKPGGPRLPRVRETAVKTSNRHRPPRRYLFRPGEACRQQAGLRSSVVVVTSARREAVLGFGPAPRIARWCQVGVATDTLLEDRRIDIKNRQYTVSSNPDVASAHARPQRGLSEVAAPARNAGCGQLNLDETDHNPACPGMVCGAPPIVVCTWRRSAGGAGHIIKQPHKGRS